MRSIHRLRKCAAWLASLFIMLSGARYCLADQEDLLSVARAGHRAARQSIQSFTATITKVVTSNGDKSVQTGKYWRSLDVVRLQEKGGSGSEDYLLKDSEIRQVGRGTDPKTGQKEYGAARRPATEFLGMLDVWSEMLIDFAGPDGGHYDLDRFLEFAKEPPLAGRERKDGYDCIRVTFSVISNMGNGFNITLWHDVTRNYLVRKLIVTSDNSSHSVSDVLEFAEPLPGLFVPTKCHTEHFRVSERYQVKDVTLSDIEVNKPIPKSVFQLPAIRAGTELFDSIQGTRYPIDENWRPIGPARPYRRMGFPSKSDSSGTEYHSQSTSEARSYSWWLIIGSLMFLAVVCIYRIYRYYRPHPDLHQTS